MHPIIERANKVQSNKHSSLNPKTDHLVIVDRKRIESVVAPRSSQQRMDEEVAALAHDARNLLTALNLYCDLLDEPGVLAEPYRHYSSELRLVATASRQMIKKLLALNPVNHQNPLSSLSGTRVGATSNPQSGLQADADSTQQCDVTMKDIVAKRLTSHSANQQPMQADAPAATDNVQAANQNPCLRADKIQRWDDSLSEPIANLAEELHANLNLLNALAGPLTTVRLHTTNGGALPVRLTNEDLTRVLVNLIKNASEAMPHGGEITIGLNEINPKTIRSGELGADQIHSMARSSNELGSSDLRRVDPVPAHSAAGNNHPATLLLSISDNGPGISTELLDAIFATGFTTHTENDPDSGWTGQHRGLGLSICRSIIEAAGGSIRALHNPEGGTRIEIHLTANVYSWAPDPKRLLSIGRRKIHASSPEESIDEWLRTAD